MSAALAIPEPQSAPEHEVARVERHRRVLDALIDFGAEMARMVVQQTRAQPERAPELAVAFERIARVVRRTAWLSRRLDEPAPSGATHHREAARRRIIRGVEDVIQRHADVDEAADLHAEFRERLDSPDLEDDIRDRPTAEIIADICHDLGLAAPAGTHPWQRRTPADIAALCARAAMPPPRAWTSSDPPA